MATTTKKSSKAKTKTTKSKSASAKTTTTKKTTTKTAAKSVSKAPANVSMGMLQKLYAASAAIYLIVAAAAIARMGNTSIELNMGFLSKDELISKTQTVFAPAVQGVYDVELRWVVVFVMLFSAVLPLLYLTRLKKYNAAGLKAKVMPLRWIEMAVTSALMLETVALVSGVRDVFTLKLVGGLMAVTCLLGWMAEKRTAEAGRPATAKYYLSAVTGLLPWLLIGSYAVATYAFGEVRYTWYVYALYAVMLIGAGLLSTNQMNALKGVKSWKNYEVVERNYTVLALALRVAFAVVLIVGLMAK